MHLHPSGKSSDMAKGRNNKTGFEFYRMDTNRYQNVKIKRLLFKFQANGLYVYDFLISEIYRDKGCFLRWNNDIAFTIADTLKLDELLVNQIVEHCCFIGLFDANILEKQQVLTSKSIQNRYREMCVAAKRKSCFIPKEIKLIPEEIQFIQEEMQENSEIIQQSKVKESIVKNNLIPISNEIENLENSESVDTVPETASYFWIAGRVQHMKVSDFFRQNFQVIMEAELMKRSIDADIALNRFDYEYDFHTFENHRHLISSFKCILNKITNESAKKEGFISKKTYQKNQLTNWNA